MILEFKGDRKDSISWNLIIKRSIIRPLEIIPYLFSNCWVDTGEDGFLLIKRTLRWKVQDLLLSVLSGTLVERSRQKFNSVRNNGVKRWPASVLGPIRLYTISWESKHLPTIPNETRQALMRSRLPADTQMPSSPRLFPHQGSSITLLRVFPPPPFPRFPLSRSFSLIVLRYLLVQERATWLLSFHVCSTDRKDLRSIGN